MAGGATPLEVLLKKVKPKKDEAPKELIAEFVAAGEKQNAELAKVLDPDLMGLDSDEYVRLQIPETSMPLTFSPVGYYLPTDWPDIIAMPLEASVLMTGDSWSLTANAGKVMLQAFDTPCGGGWAVVVPKAEAKIADGRITLTGSGLNGEMNGQLKKGSDGAEWFCGTATQGHGR